jgi:ribosomal protein S6--L-glutamate ligase
VAAARKNSRNSSTVSAKWYSDLAGSRHVIRDNETLSSCIHQLQEGDIVCSRIRLKAQEEHLLLDLTERGVKLIPSATSQLASRSKTFQTRIFSSLMIPGTTAIYDIHGLLCAISLYRRMHVGRTILKHDRKNGGLGIHLFNDIEEIFTLAANNVLPFPFVLQPFVTNGRDVRVIILGDYIEAYQRTNPDNFRNNLHCGGKASLWVLTEQQIALCRKAMIRGGFPYAHIDLLLTDNGADYLTEINLRGGIRGAAITPRSYCRMVEDLHEDLIQKTLK